jgi:hypothetical protein
MTNLNHDTVVEQMRVAQEAGDALRSDVGIQEVHSDLSELGIIKPVSEGSFYHGRYAVVPADSGKFEIQTGFRRNHLQDEYCLMQADRIKDVFLASSETVANLHTDGRRKLFHKSRELQDTIQWPGLLGSYVTPQVHKIGSTDPFACIIDDKELPVVADKVDKALTDFLDGELINTSLGSMIEKYFGRHGVGETDLSFIKLCAALGIVGIMQHESLGSQMYKEPITRFIDLRRLTTEPVTPHELPWML